MTAPGITVLPLAPPTEREVELEAENERLRAAVAELRDRVEVPDLKAGDDLDLICVGSALIGEHDGGLWLVRGQQQLIWPGKASAQEVAFAADSRAKIAAEVAARRSNAS